MDSYLGEEGREKRRLVSQSNPNLLVLERNA
jgi:hypothetical protein